MKGKWVFIILVLIIASNTNALLYSQLDTDYSHMETGFQYPQSYSSLPPFSEANGDIIETAESQPVNLDWYLANQTAWVVLTEEERLGIPIPSTIGGLAEELERITQNILNNQEEKQMLSEMISNTSKYKTEKGFSSFIKDIQPIIELALKNEINEMIFPSYNPTERSTSLAIDLASRILLDNPQIIQETDTPKVNPDGWTYYKLNESGLEEDRIKLNPKSGELPFPIEVTPESISTNLLFGKVNIGALLNLNPELEQVEGLDLTVEKQGLSIKGLSINGNEIDLGNLDVGLLLKKDSQETETSSTLKLKYGEAGVDPNLTLSQVNSERSTNLVLNNNFWQLSTNQIFQGKGNKFLNLDINLDNKDRGNKINGKVNMNGVFESGKFKAGGNLSSTDTIIFLPGKFNQEGFHLSGKFSTQLDMLGLKREKQNNPQEGGETQTPEANLTPPQREKYIKLLSNLVTDIFNESGIGESYGNTKGESISYGILLDIWKNFTVQPWGNAIENVVGVEDQGRVVYLKLENLHYYDDVDTKIDMENKTEVLWWFTKIITSISGIEMPEFNKNTPLAEIPVDKFNNIVNKIAKSLARLDTGYRASYDICPPNHCIMLFSPLEAIYAALANYLEPDITAEQKFKFKSNSFEFVKKAAGMEEGAEALPGIFTFAGEIDTSDKVPFKIKQLGIPIEIKDIGFLNGNYIMQYMEGEGGTPKISFNVAQDGEGFQIRGITLNLPNKELVLNSKYSSGNLKTNLDFGINPLTGLDVDANLSFDNKDLGSGKFNLKFKNGQFVASGSYQIALSNENYDGYLRLTADKNGRYEGQLEIFDKENKLQYSINISGKGFNIDYSGKINSAGENGVKYKLTLSNKKFLIDYIKDYWKCKFGLNFDGGEPEFELGFGEITF